MPYIKPEDRKRIDPIVEPLIAVLKTNGFSEGELNYAVSRICWAAFKNWPRYATVNKIKGFLGCVWSEFYRRIAAPYEDQKIAENGDLPEAMYPPQIPKLTDDAAEAFAQLALAETNQRIDQRLRAKAYAQIALANQELGEQRLEQRMKAVATGHNEHGTWGTVVPADKLPDPPIPVCYRCGKTYGQEEGCCRCN